MIEKESEDIKDKNPNFVPIISERAFKSRIKEKNITKLLIKKNLTIEYMRILKKN